MVPKFKYKEIWATSNHFYEKIKQIHEKRPIEKQWETYRETYRDYAHNFFLFCYHIKDWIKNDPAVDKSVKDAVEDYINQNNCLKICADIANGIKHLSLEKMRSKTRPNIVAEEHIIRADGKKKSGFRRIR